MNGSKQRRWAAVTSCDYPDEETYKHAVEVPPDVGSRQQIKQSWGT
jgi:hypothetical protein